ncbi:MAG: ferritin-like domain-containing protein [Alistipes sp.]
MENHNQYQQSIDLMNQALGKEVATSLQYIYFHVYCENMGYKYLATMWRNTSIAEMRHIEELSERILFLKGDVELNPAFLTKQIHNTKEMLQMAVKLEQSTIDEYNASSKICDEVRDAGSQHLFRELLEEEEKHIDAFQIELQNVVDYGMEYLALQAIARSREKNEAKVGDWIQP